MISDFINQSTEEIAAWIHERYEAHATWAGWETPEDCQVDFDDLPKANKETMMLLAKDIRLRDMRFLEAVLAEIKQQLVEEESLNDLTRNRIERVVGSILRVARIALL